MDPVGQCVSASVLVCVLVRTRLVGHFTAPCSRTKYQYIAQTTSEVILTGPCTGLSKLYLEALLVCAVHIYVLVACTMYDECMIFSQLAFYNVRISSPPLGTKAS